MHQFITKKGAECRKCRKNVHPKYGWIGHHYQPLDFNCPSSSKKWMEANMHIRKSISDSSPNRTIKTSERESTKEYKEQ